MKNMISFIILILGFTLNCYSQQLLPLNNIVEIKLPAGIQKLNSEQIRADFDSIKFGTKLLDDNLEVYKLNNILISFKGGKHTLPANFLIKRKKEYDESFQSLVQYANYTSYIKSINNYDVLVVNFNNTHDVNKSSLYLMNHKHNLLLAVSIRSLKSDSVKNKSVARQILQSIHFKE